MEVTCSQCNKVFNAPPSRVKKAKNIFCSEICYHESMRNQVLYNCSNCGIEFKTVQSKIDKFENLFCCIDCTHKFRTFRQKVNCANCKIEFEAQKHKVESGKDLFCSKPCKDNFAKVPRIKRFCLNCFKEFKCTKAQMRDTAKTYCSRDCSVEHRVGKYHPTFKNGINYFKSFPKINSCSICNTKGKTDLHHIDGDRTNNVESNFKEVCRSCHMRIHKLSLKNSINLPKALEIIIDLQAEAAEQLELDFPEHLARLQHQSSETEAAPSQQ